MPSDEGTKPKRKSKRRKIAYTSDFEAFWKGYPTDANMGKEETFLFWQKIDPEERELAIRSLPAFNEYCRKNPDYRPVHAVRYLSKKRFEGHAQAHAETISADQLGSGGVVGSCGRRAGVLVYDHVDGAPSKDLAGKRLLYDRARRSRVRTLPPHAAG